MQYSVIVRRCLRSFARAAILIGCAGVPMSSVAEEEAPALPVEAQPVIIGEVQRIVQAVGTLRANESVTLRPEIQGRVESILFEEGQPVKAGAALIRLDDDRYRAELNEAVANRDLAAVNFRRAEQLIQRKVGSEHDRDKAAAELEANQARVALHQETLSKTALTAPFDGVAALREVSVGDIVSPGQALTSIVAIDPIKVDFRVPELYVGAVQPGQSLQVVLDAFPGERFSGQVYAIDPQVDVQGRSILIRATVPNPDARLRPGLFARVELVLERFADAVQVPEEAVVPRGGDQFVYRIVDGKAEMTAVKLGIRRGARVQVLEGLDPGDVVITAGQLKVQPGAAVVPVNLEQQPASGPAGADV